MTSPNTSGTNQLPNEIQNTQTQSSNFDVSHVICNADGTIDIKGQLVFDPPQPIADASKIFSPDLSSQLQCINGGQITVLGEIQGYSTTAQTSSSIGTAIGDLSSVYMPIGQTLNNIPLADGTIDVNDQQIDNLSDPTDLLNAVNLQYLQNNYTDTIQSEQFVNAEIDLLSTVYMPIGQTLNNIPLAEGVVDLNQQQINNLADPTSSLNAVNLQYLENNYTDTTNSQAFVGNAIGDLSTVYMPIDQTLNNIPLATASLNVNNNKIINLTAGTDPTDAVCLSQLDGYIPVSGNINDLTAQTADYSTSGFQINNSALPTIGDNLTNKTYVDNSISALSTVYYPQTDTLSDIAVPIQTMDFNGQLLSNIGLNSLSGDAVRQDYLTTNYTTTSSLNANYPSNASLSITLLDYVTLVYLQATYYTSSYIDSTFQTLAGMSNYVSNSALTITLGDYVLTSFLTANYLTSTVIASTYASIASLSDYVTNSSLAITLSSYVSNSSLTTTLSDYVLTSFLTANYLTSAVIASTYATIASLSNYVSNSSLATTLSGYLQIANIAQYTTFIQTNTGGTKSKVDCTTNSEILFNIADVQKLKMYVPAGQSTQPLGLLANDKIQMISGENSFSLTGQKALQAKPTQNYSGLYISGLDNAALNVGQQIQIGSQFCQKLALASGHTDISGTQVLYSSISNSAEGVAQQNLQISGGTPQTDNTLVLYSDSFATAIGQPISAQFTKKTGYSTTTSITEANQFSSKAYVDSAVLGLSSIYLTIANAASTYQTIANMSQYYTKAVTDATFATIASLSSYVTGSQLTTALSSYLTIASASSTYLTQASASSIYQTIAGMSAYLTTASASALYYTQTYIDSTFATIASLSAYLTITSANATYVLQTTPLNDLALPTGDLAMEGFEIKGLQLVPSIASSAASKSYVDSQVAGGGLTKAVADTYYYSFANTNLPTQSLNMNSQKITELGNATLATDALNRQTGDGRYYLNTVPLQSITAPTGSLSLNSQKITNLANATLATDALNRQTADGRYYLSTTVLNSITAPTSSLSLNSQKIINLATPTLSTDAATKGYVDSNIPSSFKTATINIGALATTTTAVNVTSVTGFITSATKAKASSFTPGGNLITVNYANLGYVPIFLCTAISTDSTSPLINGGGLTVYQFTATATQATFGFTIVSNSTVTSTFQMNVMIANSLVL